MLPPTAVYQVKDLLVVHKGDVRPVHALLLVHFLLQLELMPAKRKESPPFQDCFVMQLKTVGRSMLATTILEWRCNETKI